MLAVLEWRYWAGGKPGGVGAVAAGSDCWELYGCWAGCGGLYKLSCHSSLALVNEEGEASGACVDGACADGACVDGACAGGACTDGACAGGACTDGACGGACADGACGDRACADGVCADKACMDGACRPIMSSS